ncbi:hypothetical protein HWV62_24029 [Athelia sp. TMB]|nr:hypothetical protein HWV62_24029 [Athelia sp. TMB]
MLSPAVRWQNISAELLVTIAHLAVPDVSDPDDDNFPSRQKAVSQLSQVCKLWHTVIINQPLFWTSLKCNASTTSAHNIKTIVYPRARSHPLHAYITIPGSANHHTARVFGTALAPLGPQISALKIVCDANADILETVMHAMRFSQLLGLQLLTVCLKEKTITDAVIQPSMPSACANLQRLNVQGFNTLGFGTCAKLSVVILSGSRRRIPVHHLATSLERLPSLKSLTFVGTPIQFHSSQNVQEIARLLPSSALPSLQHVSVRGHRSRKEPTRHYFQKTMALLARIAGVSSLEVEIGAELGEFLNSLKIINPLPRYPQLINLLIRFGTPNTQHVQGLMNALPPIEYASLRVSLSPIIVDATLRYRHVPPAEDNMPVLRTLELTFDNGSDFKTFMGIAGSKKNHGFRRVVLDKESLRLLELKGLWGLPEIRGPGGCGDGSGRHTHITYSFDDEQVPRRCLC